MELPAVQFSSGVAGGEMVVTGAEHLDRCPLGCQGGRLVTIDCQLSGTRLSLAGLWRMPIRRPRADFHQPASGCTTSRQGWARLEAFFQKTHDKSIQTTGR